MSRHAHLAVAVFFGLITGTVLGAFLDKPALRILQAFFPAPEPSRITDRVYVHMTNFHKRLAGSIPEGSILFIGDSITQGLWVSAVSEQGVNLGIAGDTVFGVEYRLRDFKALPYASLVVLAVGVNDLKTREPDEIEPDYQRLLTTIPDSVAIVWSSVLPVDENMEWFRRWNERIRDLNARAARLCAARPNCTYLDAFTPMAIGEKGLPAGYHTGDGIHLNTAGYAAWIDVLREAIPSALQRSGHY